MARGAVNYWGTPDLKSLPWVATPSRLGWIFGDNRCFGKPTPLILLTMPTGDPGYTPGLQQDLIPVNAVIGFLKRDRRWPSVLYDVGYRLTMIDQPVSVANLGRAEIDVIMLKPQA
jgi:hypothetical protein